MSRPLLMRLGSSGMDATGGRRAKVVSGGGRGEVLGSCRIDVFQTCSYSCSRVTVVGACCGSIVQLPGVERALTVTDAASVGKGAGSIDENSVP